MAFIMPKRVRRRDLQRSFMTENTAPYRLPTAENFDWEKILSGADWFHFTGITPALSDGTAEICLDALKTAKKLGVKTSCDLNFRKNLWTSEKAGRVMGELMTYVDLCIANEEDADKVFGIKAASTDVETGKLDREGYKDVAKQLCERFGCSSVAITLRESITANDNNWAAMLYWGGECLFLKKYAVHIVDRVGGGDSLGAGLIYSLVKRQVPRGRHRICNRGFVPETHNRRRLQPRDGR